ncbi:MAG: hypothetical protein CVU40_01305 [Chloroflexi bacterium HGW-Chloroflexi-2]|jgi:hypothetical protein|nr:MAG: hypothetical protein CVU40_01305 [Chloroflexi bacterium HGW-Chloroflexi-2]
MGIVLPLHMHHTFLCYVGLYQNTILKIARIVLEAYKNFDRAFLLLFQETDRDDRKKYLTN